MLKKGSRIISMIVFVLMFNLNTSFAFEGVEHTYARLLTSDNVLQIQAGAKSLYINSNNRENLLDLAAEILWKKEGVLTTDSKLVDDTKGWLIKALRQSGNRKYSAVISKVL